MATKIYGQSDDNIYLEGDVDDQLSAFDMERRLIFNDGTILDIRYGKTDPDGGELGVWAIKVVEKGHLFESHKDCQDEDDDPYSDIVMLKDGARLVHHRSTSEGACRNWSKTCIADGAGWSKGQERRRELRDVQDDKPLVIIEDGYVYVPYDSNVCEVRIELAALRELVEASSDDD